MKGILAEAIHIDPDGLPYREDLLAYLRGQHAEGRQWVLVTATHQLIARRVADFIGIFSGVKGTSILAEKTKGMSWWHLMARASKIDKIFVHHRNWFNIILRSLRVHQWANTYLLDGFWQSGVGYTMIQLYSL
jgi:hypothetical protein